MYYLDGILSIFIKACMAAIIGCVAYVYVKTIKNPDYKVHTNLFFGA